ETRLRRRFASSHQSKKEPRASVRPILFCKQTLYGERNSEIVHAFRTRGAVRVHECVSGRSTATAANARGNYYDLRASCGKSRAERCDSIYHTNSLARTVGLFAFG